MTDQELLDLNTALEPLGEILRIENGTYWLCQLGPRLREIPGDEITEFAAAYGVTVS